MSFVRLEIWHLVLLLAMFVSVVWTAGRLLLGQIDKRLDTRFDGMEQAREQNTVHWDNRFRALMEDQKKGSDAWRNLERDFLKFRGDLPLEYVRREDFIRNQSVIEAKLDALALHLQNLQLKGVRHDRPE
ncbi:MAG: hypothetical protein M0Z99_20410 [Betaproteobacteria bacterium]|nr:hypothetical protein [Betaproteobacteria bacterium]